jgi:integrase
LLPLFEGVRLKEINPQMLQGSISKWTQQGLARNTVKGAVMALRTMWKTAKAWDYVTHNPFDGLVFPDRDAEEQRFFTVEELQKILAAAEGTFQTFLYLLAETGMRVGEAMALRLRDVDLKQGVVNVRQTMWRGTALSPKTAKSRRTFAISPPLQERFKMMFSVCSADLTQYVFQTRTGGPWDYTTILSRKLKPLLVKLELPDAGFHAFRHGNVSLMNQYSVHPMMQQERLGHSSFSSTMIYTHTDRAADKKFAEEMGRVLHPEALPASDEVQVLQ